MKIYDFLNYNFTKWMKIFRIKKHINILFAITTTLFVINIFYSIHINRKINYLLFLLENKIHEKKNKDNFCEK